MEFLAGALFLALVGALAAFIGALIDYCREDS